MITTTYHIPPMEKEIAENVIEATCQYFDITKETLLCDTSTSVANMRFMCFYLIMNNTSLKDYVVGDMFNKSRNVVRYGKNHIEFQISIYGQSMVNLRSIKQIANNFEKKYEWLLQ